MQREPGSEVVAAAGRASGLSDNTRLRYEVWAGDTAPADLELRLANAGVTTIEAESIPIEAGCAFFDIDGDGDLDLVGGEDYQGGKVYWWENPSPHFAPGTPWTRHVIKGGGAHQHHDHLVCIRCGKIIEFECEMIEKAQEQIAERYQFRVLRHRHELYGHCGKCQGEVRRSI